LTKKSSCSAILSNNFTTQPLRQYCALPIALHLPLHWRVTSKTQRWQQNFRVNGFTVTATGATGFFDWQVWESDRDGFVGLKVKNSGLIGRFKEGSDPIFSGYGAFPAVLWFRLHDRPTNVANGVGKH
jgi:hypothetical protein